MNKNKAKRIFNYTHDERFPNNYIDDDETIKPVESPDSTCAARVASNLKNNRKSFNKKVYLPKETKIWSDKYHVELSNLEKRKCIKKELQRLLMLRNQYFQNLREDNYPFVSEYLLKLKAYEKEQVNKNNAIMEVAPSANLSAIELVNLPPSKNFIKIGSISIKEIDLSTLAPCQWLNDQIINAYMQLIQKRNSSCPNKLPSVCAMSTFFFEQLKYNTYIEASKWTREINIFEIDLLLIPINIDGNHWALVVVNMKTSTITYYDSLTYDNVSFALLIRNYLILEKQRHPETSVDPLNFQVRAADGPFQQNSYDCGVFICMYAEHVARQAPITFQQEDMCYCRNKMLSEILCQQLLTDSIF